MSKFWRTVWDGGYSKEELEKFQQALNVLSELIDLNAQLPTYTKKQFYSQDLQELYEKLNGIINPRIPQELRVRLLEVYSCTDCPFLKREKHRSTGVYDQLTNWICYHKDRKAIAEAMEVWAAPPIPEWCRLAVKGKPKDD